MVNRINTTDVKELFECNGYQVLVNLEEEYKNNTTKIKLLCPNGHEIFMGYGKFKAGQRCKYCQGKDTKTIEHVRKEFEKIGYQLLETEYNHSEIRLRFICSSGHNSAISFYNLSKGHRCGVCRYERQKGKGNPAYNHEISDEERAKRNRRLEKVGYKPWIRSVYFRDNYTCQKCKKQGGKLHAHHILPYSLFPKLRCDIDNGVTLCGKCHKEYHKIYLYGSRCNPKTLKTFFSDSRKLERDKLLEQAISKVTLDPDCWFLQD